ncbi:MAG: T9SS type A sorting domain-containing protein [Flavisolibacter sp.]
MKKIITSLFTLSVLLTFATKIYSQGCLTGGSFTAISTYTFNTNAQDFSGDFSWTSQGSGELESTPMSAGQTKILNTATLFQPASNPTVAFSFSLGGTANVNSYSIDAVYNNGSGLTTVPVCTGGALSTTGATLTFAATAPAAIQGTNFRLKITFNSTSTGNKTLQVDNFSSNVGAAAAPLPVTFTYFGASATTGGIKLTWMVATESNVNRYDVERSANGKTFSKIGQVTATGATTYTYLDAAYQTGSNYYRLKSVDNDGAYKYSTIVLFKVGKNTLSSLRTYPVPATSDVTVFHDPATSTSSISIVSTDGRVLKTIIPVVGATETQISISSLKSGLYMIRYSILESGVITTKLVKQ